MPELEIVPVDLGTLRIDKSLNTYMLNVGVTIDQPLLAWVIRGGDRTIVVDSGAPSPEWCAQYQRPIQQASHQAPEQAFRAAGVDPAEVDVLILSHLHWDHVGSAGLFKNATIYVQRTELQYAAAPLPVHARGYQSSETGLRPLWDGVRLTAIHGDRQLAPGVSVILTPGHSPGSQCVVVEARRGKRYLIAADTVPLYDNWRGVPPLQPHIPNTIHVGLEEYYASFTRMEAFCDEILPGHDPEVLSRDVYA